ncbi:Hypothetical protein CINCED_3A015319 [Cinara cedri]|uniref:Fatty acid desaturase domain-containing protein n=1 Tax=Cinara cedri TaxID=506608 RepID=A0A5E4MSH8_9HEMI|nr:Hypothetical protein CINCED_3A015319 [Cinara cedri]
MKDITQKQKQDTDEEVLSRVPDNKQKIKWVYVVYFTLVHILAIIGLYNFCNAKYQTIIFSFVVGGIGGFGVTGGAHRYYSHKSFKANLPLQIILLLCYSVSGQHSLVTWVRDHRMHHKFSETDADPHNANRGFFYAHIGWLMQHHHPEYYKRSSNIDVSDIINDPLVQFHAKYFFLAKILICFVLPIIIPVYAWNESWKISLLVPGILRYVCNLNFTFSVNSIAHFWGHKPYNKSIQPVQNLIVSILAMGEGWHNYHHVFPMDYRTSELGGYLFNLTTMWLDFFARIGWAYDLKTPSEQLVRRVAINHGDGSWHDASDKIILGK